MGNADSAGGDPKGDLVSNLAGGEIDWKDEKFGHTAFGGLSLPEKDEQGGSNFLGGIRNLTIEETHGYDRDDEKTDDQSNQEISNQSAFGRGDYHRDTSLFNERLCRLVEERISLDRYFLFKKPSLKKNILFWEIQQEKFFEVEKPGQTPPSVAGRRMRND